MNSDNNHYHGDIINSQFIDYIIKSYVPELQIEGYRLNMRVFRQAMIHQSIMPDSYLETYERLEYLGDAIFHMVVTEYICDRYDEEAVGFLTKLRIKLERGDSMVQLTTILTLDQYVQIAQNLYLNDHILEDIFESFIGAFFLNFGMKYTKKFIVALLEKHKDFAALIAYEDNYKDMLLQFFHKIKWGYPKYIERINSNGYFISIVKNPFGKVLGKGAAKSKIKSEQIASKNSLIACGIDINDEIGIDWINKINMVVEPDNIKKNKKNADYDEENKMSIFNPNNKLFNKSDIKNLLLSYNVLYPANMTPDLKTFYEAMTHKSYIKRKKLSKTDFKNKEKSVPLQAKSNERLQFLGDSVIHFIVGDYLYHHYTYQNEGFMTRLRCKLENKDSLFFLSKQSHIDQFLLLSQTIDVLHGRNNVNIIKGGLQAFVGALYLELGLRIAKEFVVSLILTEVNLEKLAEHETNYKELISQLFIKNKLGYPIYEVIKTEGPDHSKIFTMGLYYNNELKATGRAHSKRKAEQIASKRTYRLLQKDKTFPK